MTPSSFRNTPSRQEMRKALKKDERDLQRMRLNIDALRAGRHIENLRLPEALEEERGLMRAVANKRKLLGWPSSQAAIEKDLTPAPVNYDDWAEHRKRLGLEGAKTKLDLLLDRVGPGKGELTLDVEGYTEAQVERVIKTAKDRGLHVSGTDRWLLIRDLSKMHLNGLDVADEIWRQLGRARVMIGAKDPVGEKDALTFKIGANPKRVKWIKIRLDPDDTYSVRFINSKSHTLHEIDGVYADYLARVIERHTELRTSL